MSTDKKSLEFEMDKLYDKYVEAIRAAYVDEAHFCAQKPRSPELAQKASEAYKAFDHARTLWKNA